MILLAFAGFAGAAHAQNECHCNIKHDMRHEHNLKAYKYTRQAGYVSQADCAAFEAAGMRWRDNSTTTTIGRNSVGTYMGYSRASHKTAPESPNTDMMKGAAPQSPNGDAYYK